MDYMIPIYKTNANIAARTLIAIQSIYSILILKDSGIIAFSDML